jgi:hypothetical protein
LEAFLSLYPDERLSIEGNARANHFPSKLTEVFGGVPSGLARRLLSFAVTALPGLNMRNPRLELYLLSNDRKGGIHDEENEL